MMLADIQKAADAIRGAVPETPFHHSVTLSAVTGAELFIKFENLQFTASFKERGALNRLLSLTPGQRKAGVVAMSAGNHAQAVAYHASRLGIAATIVMPGDTPEVKVAATRAHGAVVVLEGATLSDSEVEARRLAGEQQLVLVHPYDDPAVIAGQGTIALEMLAAQPDLDVLVVPIGGGGLIAGMATAAKAIRPDIEVIGVQAQRCPSMDDALRGRAPAPFTGTIAEGIAVKRPGSLALPIIRDKVDGIVLADEGQLEQAIALYIAIEKTVAEGAGAAALAGILAEPERFRGRKVGVVLSGGNIDTRLLASVLMRDLVHQGRIARLRIDIPDRPGVLAVVAGTIGEAGGNILEVQHNRTFSHTQAKETDLGVVIEARDPNHLKAIVGALSAEGFRVRLLDADGPGQ
ncbi:threonine ammonia-lyase [Emcibacter sp. SYSU 3D8]|uniref:threonine ammonia-lyase n=1 Tax=Emcibacter sp. SYSU 3D8 TaxID=3133969 RepID=UPI0031FF200E